MQKSELPTTNNESWGFFGTIRNHADADKAWTLAFVAISKACDGDAEAVRDFLDSRHGRHFADEVVNQLSVGAELTNAIDAAVAVWRRWRIGPALSRETGIPAGLTYLTGLVANFSVIAEAA